MNIHYEGYLIEKKLGLVLDQVSQGLGVVIKRQYRVGNQRCDFALLDSEEKLLLVYEFDGPSHYQSSNTFDLDRRKDELVKELGGVMIRVPYFVQLKDEVLEYFFPALNLTSTVEYKHGFISKKAPLPSSFTDQGLHFFCYQLEKMPRPVARAILKSLEDKGFDYKNMVYLPKFIFVEEANKVHGEGTYGYDEVPNVVKVK